jgi:hypothetical protein
MVGVESFYRDVRDGHLCTDYASILLPILNILRYLRRIGKRQAYQRALVRSNPGIGAAARTGGQKNPFWREGARREKSVDWQNATLVQG